MAALKLFSLCICILLTLTHSASDVELLLMKIKPSLQGTAENLPLLSWNVSVPLCQWRGLKWAFSNGSSLLCSDLSSPQWTSLSLYKEPFLQLISLQLPSANLSGTLPKEIGELTNLQSLYLGVNSLSGPIPLELGYSSSLSDIDLSHNLLKGSLPTSIWNLCDRLVSLRLHGNSVSGSLPEPALPDATCKNLQVLDLGQNGFTGNFPEFIVGFHGLKQLDLGDNVFSGPIPVSITESRVGKPVLNWARRHKIALGIARGLAHLHGLETPITHGNVRSKTILVDDFFVARLNEFGLDKIMVPSVADEIVALAKTDGYKAPELQKMKKCNSRTDVYAFGIVLLEILLGKRPGKTGRNGEFVDLPSLVKVAVLEETTMEVFDVELLKGIRNPMEEGLVQALKLAMGCCAPVASVRPTMDEVVRQLEENRPRNRSALYSPAETRSGSVTPF
ncbi:UNVERIFIED_CONTAM: putative kinase-like protein TMKL1 [Sesamum angustifolium]|uniref:Kinase-like protein TMKL1 n=1 Tax=Sesamum angustifolium TaxID=2727405 RepID=A0AAW2QRI0_9LAMI